VSELDEYEIHAIMGSDGCECAVVLLRTLTMCDCENLKRRADYLRGLRETAKIRSSVEGEGSLDESMDSWYDRISAGNELPEDDDAALEILLSTSFESNLVEELDIDFMPNLAERLPYQK
jgi:hypothetical protein